MEYTEYQLEQIQKDIETVMATRRRLKSMGIKAAMARARAKDADHDDRRGFDEDHAPKPFPYGIQTALEQSRAEDPDGINNSNGSWN